MNLSTLPWITRREIIDLVIIEHPQYCSVNREWLKQVTIRHGYTYYDYIVPNKIEKKTVCIPYIRKIIFNRAPDIDWGELSKYQNLKRITFNFAKFSTTDIEAFESQLPPLPFLDNIIVNAYTMGGGTSFNVKSLVEKTCHQLKELTIPMEQLSEHPKLTNMKFPNLISLSLNHVRGTPDLTNIMGKMSLLKSLKIESYEQHVCFINITQEIIPDLVALKCGPFIKSSSKLVIDLNKLPKLKKLTTSSCLVEIIRPMSDNNIEELAFIGTSDEIFDLLDFNSSNLSHLDLYFLSYPDHETMSYILELCDSLSSLKLEIWDDYEFDDTLLVGTYSVTNLQLCGDIILNSKLLIWLSNNFKLTHLELNHCRLDDDIPLKPVAPFLTLQSLIIRTKNHLIDFESRFNHTLYPHIDTINVNRTCHTCNVSIDSSIADELDPFDNYQDLVEDNNELF